MADKHSGKFGARDRERFSLTPIEPRILFSADAAAVLAASIPDPIDFQDSLHATVEQVSRTAIAASTSSTERDDASPRDNVASNAAAQTRTVELVIIDRAVDDAEWIAQQFARDDSVDRVIAFLDTDRDGLDQLSELIAQHDAISAVHLFSHGQDSILQLGNGQLTQQELLVRADQISQWSESFTADADLLIYGCDLASSDSGIEFATTLGQLTGTDVAASDDISGSKDQVGDWVLEYSHGTIETDTSLAGELLADYSGSLLTTYIVTSNADNGANTLRWAIDQANADGQESVIRFESYMYISLQSMLPSITSQVTIENTSGDGWPSVILDGAAATAADGLHLGLGSDGSSISGLSIRNFDQSGIFIENSDNNALFELDIGSDGDDANDYGNGWYGIELRNAANNAIGKTTSLVGGERVLISDNGIGGILMTGAGSTGNTVNDTVIGISWSGTAIANGSGAPGHAGILLANGASSNSIGESNRNVIAGNDGAGIWIDGSTTTDNIIVHNFIGVWLDGTTALGNAGHGVHVLNGASDNMIGGPASNDGNLIANNGADGIRIHGTNTDGNSILRNLIYDNAGRSIGLGDGTTANDLNDSDSGANDEQNHLIIDSATTDEAGFVYGSATLHSTPNSDFRVEFFATSSENASGRGGATEYLGSTTLHTDGNGDATFSGAFSATLPHGSILTATVTEYFGGGSYGSTSEFATNVVVVRTNADPTFTSSNLFLINENGTEAGTVTVSDSDGDTPSFSLLATQDHAFFSIDSATGVLSFLSAPDHESPGDGDSNNDYQVTVQVDDGYGGVVTQSVTVRVNDLNEFDVSTISDLDNGGNTVLENSSNGTTVGITASATDADTTDAVTYSLTNDSGGLFSIDSNSGVVTVAGGLDRESASSHQIEVTATSSDGTTSSRTFTILVGDVDEFNVSAIADNDAAAEQVDEDAGVGTTVGITAHATDADSTDTVSYSLTNDAGGLFTIDANSGVVTVAGALDRETADSHQIQVTATSRDGFTSNRTFIILISDVDEFDVSAIADSDAAADQVDEDAAIGATVGITASASDTDSTDTVSYSLTDSASGLFAIDANSGVVTVAGVLDREAASSHQIQVTATSSDGSTSNRTYTILVGDVNEFDVSAIADGDAAAEQVDEDAAVGATVGITASATDADSTDTVSYSLTDSAGGLFAIDANTGVVTVAGALDRETGASRQIEVTATSSDGSTSARTFTILVGDVDEFDISAISDSNAAAQQVDEDAAIGATVGVTASATDADSTDTVSYSLTDSAGGLFAIDANTGVVTVAGALDYESATSHQIEVTATSSDGSTAIRTFTILVGDVDEFDVSAISDSNAAAEQIDEDAGIGATVGITAAATDADSTDTISYSLTDSAGGLFAIDANSGVVTVAGALDRETAASHQIEVTATSSDGSTATRTFTILVRDVDEFDVSAISDSNATAEQVDEDAAVGATVGITASATDADSTDTVSYSLTDSAGGLFAIDANTGVVTVAAALDRETAASHQIEVTATSSDGSTAARTFTILVGDVDEFDVSAISDSNAAADQVDEDAAIGATVGITASATDADSTDTVSYSLTDSAGGLFAIDANSGVVTVAGALDRETAASHQIEVTATSSDGSTSTRTFTILVGDVDEFDVSAIADGDAAAEEVDEDATVGATVGITANATDADSSDIVSYSLTDSAGGLFAIDANSGVVTVAGALDRETAASHQIEVTATSSDGSTATRTFTILVRDVDEFDVSAISDSNATAEQVDEDAAIGAAVGITAAATDADSTDTVSYSLTDNAGGLFAIDANTGVVTVAGALDRETAASHQIEVTATSSDGSTSTRTFTILVGDVDEFDVSAIADGDAAAEQVDEDATVGATVGITANAIDADSSDTVSYSLTDSAGGLFAIDANSGVVTVAGALDRETAASHQIEVTATSSDGSTATRTFTILVGDVDEFDVSAIADGDAAAEQVDEDATVGATVGITASATDADSTDTVSYSLTDSAGGLFAIDANSGVVTVAGALDRETAASHQIEVTATSSDGSTSTRTFTILVGDVDEFNVSAIADSDAAAEQVDEDATVGATVGITASANDADSTDNTVSYSLTDSAGGLFAIDASTGVVTVAGALDRETAASHQIEVTATSSDGSTSTRTFTILVGDVDEFDVSAIADGDAAAEQVDEDATVGATVGITASASDTDSTDTVSYSLTDSAGGLFAIDANSGVVTVAGALDRETAASHQIEVTATSSDGSTAIRTFTILVGDVDEFDVSAIADGDSAAEQVDEDATAGAFVGITANATDADSTDTVSYSLTDNAGGLFAIDANTGVVTVAGALDRETAVSHQIEVTATSSDGSTSTRTFTILVGDVDEFDVSAISDTNAAAEQVDEDAAIGAAVGITAAATDADSTDIVSYSLTDNAGGLFAIDANTGVVTVAGALDRETAASHQIEVTATSSDGSTSTRTFTILVGDVDEFDVSAIADGDAAAEQVDEDATVGATVGITANANDADSSDTVSYSLTDSAGGLFAIDANSGVVTVAGALDRETAASHQIEVTATSSDGSTSTRTFTILVGDVDEFDVSAIADGDAAAEQVDEDATVGATVGITANANDADSSDTVSYSLTDSAGGLFAIDANSGVVTVAGALDRETAASHQIEVTATSSDGSTATRTFTILVGDVDEFDVSAISDSNATAEQVDEDAAIGAAVGITAAATDADSTDTVSYSLTDSAGGLFAIDANTGVVTVDGALDYESATSHQIEVTATSSDGSTSTRTFTILVGDVDEFDVSAISDSNATAEQIDEDAAVGATVGITASATDADSTDTVSYSLTDSAGGLFAIDANTGVVTVAAALDRETAASHQIEVTATSSDGSTAARTFTILVGDVDEFDVSAISDSNAAADQVDEDAAIGATVGITASATDADSTDTVSYSLTDSAGGLFAIDANSGVVTVVGALDRETAASHQIEVTATSSDGSTSARTFTILVGDVDEFDVSTIADADPAADQVDEDAAVGATVGITASAADADSTDTVSYSLTDSAGGLFAIDANSGVVTVAGALDYESATSHQIEVTATSSDGSTATRTFTILVGDVDEFDVSAISDSNAAAEQVDEDAAIGATVGITASASDADSTDTVSYSLTDSAGGLFAIDANTGVVTVAGALDRETAASHHIEVTATSSDGSTATRTFTILVGDVDEFDVSTIADIDSKSNTVSDNASIGTAVGIAAAATDGDSTATISYTLAGDANGLFTIDTDTGIVTTNMALSSQSAGDHTIEVVALSSDGSSATRQFTIVISRTETVPDFLSAAEFSMPENTLSVGTVEAISLQGSRVSYALETGQDASLFQIDANTGQLRFLLAPDFESPSDANADNRHAITVIATSESGQQSRQDLTITVTNVNEMPVIDGTEMQSTSSYTGVIGKLNITDPDSGDQVALTITGGDAAQAFRYDQATGDIVQTGTLADGVHTLQVMISDSAGNTMPATLTIVIMNDPTLEAAMPSFPDSNFTVPTFGTVGNERPLGYSRDSDSSESATTSFEVIESVVENAGDQDSEGAQAESTAEEEVSSNSDLLFEDVFDTSALVDSSADPSSQDDESLTTENTSVAASQSIHTSSEKARLNLLLETLQKRTLSLSPIVADKFQILPFQLSLSPTTSSGTDSLAEELAESIREHQKQQQLVVAVGTGASVALTAGFVSWMLKAGVLVSAAKTSTPLWSPIDPIPVLRKQRS